VLPLPVVGDLQVQASSLGSESGMLIGSLPMNRSNHRPHLGFQGRTTWKPSGVELRRWIKEQASAMEVEDGPLVRLKITSTVVAVCCAHGATLKHRKPHHLQPKRDPLPPSSPRHRDGQRISSRSRRQDPRPHLLKKTPPELLPPPHLHLGDTLESFTRGCSMPHEDTRASSFHGITPDSI
jgi:hypothetical protein